MSKTAFIFPGQGAQTVGMGKDLADELPEAKQLFERADDILGYKLSEICFEGPEEKINSTNHSQPGLFVCSFAAIESLKKNEPGLCEKVEIAAGLSLGEYTAMVFADAISFEDGLQLVQQRGDAMQAAADETASSMVSVLGLGLSQIIEICDATRQEDEVLQVANILCPGNIVVSGGKAACERVVEPAEKAGAMRCIPLSVAGAFHTPLMESAIEKLSDALSKIEIKKPRIPVVSNVDAIPHSDPDEIRDLLIRQVHSPVQWHRSMEYMLEQNVEQFYEVGPGTVLRGLLKRINRKTPCQSVMV